MHTSLRTIALSVALLITGTSATVSLSSFTPRINNIPNAQCESAYTTTIKGCQASDFGGNARCSSACVQGLQEITELVNRACNGILVDGNSIIGVFRAGKGILSLCPGVDVPATSSTTSSRTTAAQTSSTQAATSRTSTTTSTPPPAPSTTTVTGTTTLNTQSSVAAQSSASSSQGLIVDPDPTSISGVSPTGDVQPPASSAAGRPQQPQLSNQDSGGGSPFDVQATGGSSRRTIDVMLASFISTALLFAACA